MALISSEFEGGGGNLTLALLAFAMALAIPLSSYAQKSSPTPCTVGPCVRVGVMANHGYNSATFASDGDHFITCGEGQTVEVEVLATFLSGTACRDCHDGPRTWTWEVSGATSYELVTETIGNGKRAATFALSEAGDTVSITATVGATSPGECYEGQRGRMGEHDGNHAGATATCTIKLWRMDFEATGGNAQQDPNLLFIYDTTIAESITTTATLIGATSAATDPWSWTSVVDNATQNTAQGTSTWPGIIVAESTVQVTAKVVNGCDVTKTAGTSDAVIIRPTKRRPGWVTTISHAGVDDEWHKNEANWFPGHQDCAALAQNTNTDTVYEKYNLIIVTPVYSDPHEFNEHPNVPIYFPNLHPDPNAILSVIDEVPSGPNLDLWYNSDPSIYQVARKTLVNWWITPNATAPTTPATDSNGNAYTNWLSVQAAQLGDYCTCSNPSGHSGNTTNIRYMANVWHEGYGAPSSPNQVKLGHQAQLEDAVNNGPKSDYDAVWLADLQYAHTDDELRIIDEGIRKHVQTKLHQRAQSVHIFLNPPWDEHNFEGQHRHYNFQTNLWHTWSQVLFNGCY